LDKVERQSEIDAESNSERETLAPKDKLEKTSINDELLGTIKEPLAQVPELKHAGIAQKPMQHYPEVPAVAIAIAVKGLFGHASKVAEQISETLTLDCTFYVVGKHGDFKALAKAIAKAGDRIT
jgi:predicted translin family RNA/ssDNA-binding protein